MKLAEAAAVWSVPSDSDPMGFHYVIDFGEGVKVCAECKGMRYHNRCRHTGMVP